MNRFTTTYVSTLFFIRITVSIHCIDSQQFMFLHYFLSGLLYRFTTTYVSTLLFIRITVSIHNNLCFYISFYQDYCIDSQQLMFLHLIFIRITVSIHNNLCFYISFYLDYCIEFNSNINGIPQLSMLMWNMGIWYLTTISTIFHLYRVGEFYWRRKADYPEKTTVLSQVTDKRYHDSPDGKYDWYGTSYYYLHTSYYNWLYHMQQDVQFWLLFRDCLSFQSTRVHPRFLVGFVLLDL